MPVGATGDNVAVARLHAEAYARARGFEVSAGSFQVLGQRGAPGTPRTGVAFDVVVGKGDIAVDQRVPGVLDAWTWSAGHVDWWRRILNRLDGRQGSRIVAREEAAHGGRVVPFPGGGRGGPNGGAGAVITGPDGSMAFVSGGGLPCFAKGTCMPGAHADDCPYGKTTTVHGQGGAGGAGGYVSAAVDLGRSAEPAPADQRPPWLRRGEGWDEDDADEPQGEGAPPGLTGLDRVREVIRRDRGGEAPTLPQGFA